MSITKRFQYKITFDPWLVVIVSALLCLSLLMVTSASIYIAETREVEYYYYGVRQALYIGIGIILGAIAYKISLERLYRITPILIVITFLLLVLVLLPGVGRQVNGAMRWISLGVINVQPAELAKLLSMIYIAGYLHRHHLALKSSTLAMIAPLFVLGFIGLLLLLEPDFGSTVIIFVIGLGVIFMAGVCLFRFGGMLLLTVGLMAMALFSAPYRVERLMNFRDPFADPFGSGYQLSNSLMAIGSGKLGGAGIGEGKQKLGYLPDAHTDFIFAVFSEEFGFFGALVLIVLFMIFLARTFAIGARAERLGMRFAAYLAYGVGIWFATQAFIHIGVTMGVLPTKGLTLPLVSYGGSSMISMLVAIGILFRVDIDSKGEFIKTLEQRKGHEHDAA